MGPTTNTDDIFAIYYDSRYLGQQVITTMYYRVVTPATAGADLTATYTALDGWVETLGGMDSVYAGMFTASYNNIKRVIQKIYPTRWLRRVNDSNDVAGTRATTEGAPPPNVAAAVTFQSLGVGRHGRGTKHIVATKPSDTINGVLVGAFADAIRSWADQASVRITLDAPAAGMVLEPIIYNKANAALSFGIDTYSLQTTSRVMRRRTVGQGS